MPGKLHSPLPYQRNPYVVQMKNGKTLGKFGKVVHPRSLEAHIPFEEMICGLVDDYRQPLRFWLPLCIK